VEAGIIFVPGSDKFRRVNPGKRSPADRRYREELVGGGGQRVEPAVGIFFEELKIREIVFEAIAAEIPKNTQRRLLVNKQKTTEVGIELPERQRAPREMKS